MCIETIEENDSDSDDLSFKSLIAVLKNVADLFNRYLKFKKLILNLVYQLDKEGICKCHHHKKWMLEEIRSLSNIRNSTPIQSEEYV